ncbi:MAG: OsmC family protein [Steroidobacteraceae bacterium]
MSAQAIAQAMQRIRAVVSRRPAAAIHDDEPAVARWQQDVRVVIGHANGSQLITDLPTELGGGGAQMTPGWLLRASLASCAAARIAMAAAAHGIALQTLEVSAASTSDARGLLGMNDEAGAPVRPAPRELRLQVRIGADGVDGSQLRALVQEGCRCSPVSDAVTGAIPLVVDIGID